MAEWERSGQDRAAFAAARRIDPRRLSWWRWRLGQSASTGPADGPRLVKVDVESEAVSAGRTASRVAAKVSWELATSAGVLRVYDGIDDAALATVLVVLVDKGAAS